MLGQRARYRQLEQRLTNTIFSQCASKRIGCFGWIPTFNSRPEVIMNRSLDPSYEQADSQGTTRAFASRVRVGSALRVGLAAILLSGGMSAAMAQVTVTSDTTTHGTWIGTYGSCGYVLPGQKVSPGVQTPVL